MTPLNRERITRNALQAILQGEGTIELRLDAVAGLLQKLSPPDRRGIVRGLTARLKRALNQKRAVVSSASALHPATRQTLETFAQHAGMLETQEEIDTTLLAGFTLLLGDQRLDHSLRGRLQQLSTH